MKPIKWKNLILPCIACLFPIVFGLLWWEKLPESIAIHFDINGNPDNFASKGFAVFGLPVMMMFFQLIAFFSTHFAESMQNKDKSSEKLEKIALWIIPFITFLLYLLTLGYAMGKNIDMKKSALLVCAFLFLIMGAYLPRLSYVKNYKMDPEKVQKVNRFAGIGLIILGVLAIFVAFLPPIAAIVWFFLIIAFSISNITYAIKLNKKR